MTLKSELDLLALDLLKGALVEGAKTEEKIDVFKAVATYHLGTQRVTKGKPPEGDAPTSFNDILALAKGPISKGGTA